MTKGLRRGKRSVQETERDSSHLQDPSTSLLDSVQAEVQCLQKESEEPICQLGDKSPPFVGKA